MLIFFPGVGVGRISAKFKQLPSSGQPRADLQSLIKSTQESCPLNTRAMASKSDGFMVWRLLYFIKITALFLF